MVQTSTSRYKGSAGGTNECGKRARGECGESGITNKSERAQGGTGGQISTRRADERAPGYERAWGGTSTAGAVAGAMHPSSPSPSPTIFSLSLLFKYFLHIFMY